MTAPNAASDYERTLVLLQREQELQSALLEVQDELWRLQEKASDGWLAAMEEVIRLTMHRLEAATQRQGRT